jgi:FG-GAP-like repeat
MRRNTMIQKTSKFITPLLFKIWLMATALLMATSITAFAQEAAPCPGCPIPIRVRGTVRNCAGVPLAGVTVNIEGENGNGTTVVTTASGTYNVLLAEDIYTVTPVPTTGYFFSPQNGGPINAVFTRYLRDNRANFDGDCRTDVSVFARSTGVWTSQNSSNGQIVSYSFGQNGDIATPGDYNADGKTDYAVFRPGSGTWYIETDSSSPFVFDVVQFGLSGDIPVARDYDGDAKTDIAVFRPSDHYWYILGTSTGFQAIQWGLSDDRVVPGDYDGDNKDDVAVYRPSNGTWYIHRSSDGGLSSAQFGLASDLPVQADYDGDGKTDVAVYRPGNGTWYILNSTLGWQEVQWGLSDDRVVPGDYSGDGRADTAVQRPSTGVWYVRNIATGEQTSVLFSSEFPVPAGYLTPLY